MKNIIISILLPFFWINILSADYIFKKKNIIAYYDNNKKLYKIEEDSNNDGKVDIRKYIKNNVVYRIDKDSDFDGFFETKIFLHNGRILKIEKDTNKDGKIDRVIIYKNRKVNEIKTDKNFDGKFDTVEYFKKGKLVIKNKNKNEEIIKYNNGITKIINKKGTFIYKNGFLTKAILDNGRKIIFYNKGKEVKEMIDRNGDGFYELMIINDRSIYFKKNCRYPYKIIYKNKISIDYNCDNFFEKVWIYKNNEPFEFKQDRNNDKKFDYFIFYKNKKIAKIEIDSNFDGKIDTWKYFKNGKLIKTEKDLNFDGKIDFEE